MVAIDSETTGLNLHHGCRPFLVSICDESGAQSYWEWDVDPLTREVLAPPEDVQEIRETIQGQERVLHNAKFDVQALETLDPRFGEEWEWSLTHDTLIMGHLLNSSQPHDPTFMTFFYLGLNIKPFEDRLKESVGEARRVVKSEYPQ